MRKLIVGLAAMGCLTTFASNAKAEEDAILSYNYIGANWVDIDIANADASGIELNAGFGLGKYFSIQGKYHRAETEDQFIGGGTIGEIDITQYEISLGLHAPLSTHTDFFFEFGMIEAEAKLGNSTAKADGELIRAGLRGRASSNIELSANLFRIFEDDANDSGLELGLTGYINDNWAIVTAYQDIEDSETLKFGVRFDLD